METKYLYLCVFSEWIVVDFKSWKILMMVKMTFNINEIPFNIHRVQSTKYTYGWNY